MENFLTYVTRCLAECLLIALVAGHLNLSFADEGSRKSFNWSSPTYATLQDVAEQERWDATYDKENIRFSSAVHTDCNVRMLHMPDYSRMQEKDPIDFTIAKEPPIIDFAIVQGLKPVRHGKPKIDREYAVWGGGAK